VEKDGYIWVWMTEDNTAPTGDPGITQFASGEWWQGSLEMACEYTKAIEINLDSAHVYFVHPTHPGTIAFQARGGVFEDRSHEMRITDKGLTMFSPAVATAADPIPNEAYKIHFELPNLIRLESVVAGRLLYIVMFFVPTSPRTCRMEYLVSPFQPTGIKVQWLDQVPDIFEQDRQVLEVVQATADQEGDAFERSVEADGVPLQARKIIRLATSKEWEASRASLPSRRIFHCRM
jgi:phenylpropionate dioxygenase-like ring-hydroxylating dioxygenase large terminal subunit